MLICFKVSGAIYDLTTSSIMYHPLLQMEKWAEVTVGQILQNSQVFLTLLFGDA